MEKIDSKRKIVYGVVALLIILGAIICIFSVKNKSNVNNNSTTYMKNEVNELLENSMNVENPSSLVQTP